VGYTHYWKQSKPFSQREWDQIIAEAKRIVAKAKRGLYAGPEDSGSQTKLDVDERGFRAGFNEPGAWRTFPNPDQPIPCQGAAIRIAGGDGTGRPEFTTEHIILNGAGKESYETFHLTRKPWLREGEKESFDFCKTEYRPYDAVVVSILHVARTVAPQKIKVSSDGGEGAIKLLF